MSAEGLNQGVGARSASGPWKEGLGQESNRRFGSWGCVRWLLAALIALGCGQEPRPNLLLITTDTTRADHLGCYGYPRPTSPNLDALATEAVRFERCFAHVPITLPSHASILSGTYPTFHGARDNGRFVVRDDLLTLAELLRGEGYATAAFVSAFVLDSRYGLDQGFDVYDDSYTADWSEEQLRDARIYNQMVTDRSADQTTGRALAWLSQTTAEPFFLWVHYYDPHQRYAPPHPYDQLFQDSPYDGEIAFMDDQIGELLAAFRERGQWDNTAVVVTADHGEGLGQHDETTHAALVYDSTLRVPLIVKPPASAGIAPRVEPGDTAHVDVMPTVLELLGVDPPPELHGRSLVSRMRGRPLPPPPASYFECALPRFSFGWEPLFGVRDRGWKYIHAPRRELYHLAEDPDELYNLAASETERRADFEELLFSLLESRAMPPGSGAQQAAMDAETRRKLSALGYVGGSSGTDPSELSPRQPSGRRSPVDGAAYLADYYLANGLAGRGQLRDAARVFESTLVPLDPENPSFLTGLANLKRRLGHSDQAFELYRRAQAADPGDPSILVQIGQLESDRGRLAAAEQLFLSARQLAPEDLTASYLWARTAALDGRPQEAIERYREVLKSDPSHRDSLINLGVELAKAGQVDAGRARLARALEIAPLFPRAHYNLGMLELHGGQPVAAVAAFERALRYRPYPEARLGLAIALLAADDPGRGRDELELLIAAAPRSSAAERARGLLATLD